MTQRMTAVFECDLRKFQGNPHLQDTPFGRAVTLAVGDALEAADLPPKVKPLEWEDHPSCDGPVLAKAVTLLGTYFIIDDTDDFSGLYLDLISHDNAQWWQSVRSTSKHIVEGWRGEVQPLKDKAQADYERRILSALDWPLTASDNTRTS